MSYPIFVKWLIPLTIILFFSSSVLSEDLPPAEFKIKITVSEFTPPSITVKKGQRVKLIFTTDDATHGITLTEFGLEKVLIYKDKENIVEFVADKSGTFSFPCTKYCSWRHLVGRRPFFEIKVE